MSLEVLDELWEFLKNHRHYGFAFRTEDSPVSAVPETLIGSEEALASALNRYFSEVPTTEKRYNNVADVRRRLAGKYIAYRRGWRKGVIEEFYQTSLLEIEDKG